MRVLRACSGVVIRGFKHVEHFADWITGAAGPYFVGLCWILISGGGIAFFDVIARDLPLSAALFLSPIFVLVPLNLYVQYYLVTAVPPGYPAPRPSGPTKREIKWLVPNPSSLLAPERWGFYRQSRALSGGWQRPSTVPGLGNTTKIPTSPAIGGPKMESSLLGLDLDGGGSQREMRVRRCRKCDGPKPERAHHCSVCKRCILLMDHHCPWINGCVGLHNQRHFVLFMAWLSLACWIVAFLGYSRFWSSMHYGSDWPAYTPRIGYTLLYVLAIAIGIAVPILGGWHLYMVACGETSIESHDNAYLDGRAKAEGLIYLNPFDLGKRKNLQNFFHIGPAGYPWQTLLLPLAVPPYVSGWKYPRRPLPMSARAELQLHSPELASGLVADPTRTHSSQAGGGSSRPSTTPNDSDLPSIGGGGAAENGLGSGSKYVFGEDDDLTDDEEGGGGWMVVRGPNTD